MSHAGTVERWTAGEADVAEAVKRLATTGGAGILLRLTTPTLLAAERPFPTPDAEDDALHRAWDVVVATMPRVIAAKRQAWRDFYALVVSTKEEALARARVALATLQEDATLGKLAWCLVLTPATASWEHDVLLAEVAAHDATATPRSTLRWVEGEPASPDIAILA